MFTYRVSNSKKSFLFFDFELVTRSETYDFQLWVSKPKVEKWKLNLRASNLKFNLIFYEVELATWKKNFFKNFQVSSSKCGVILRNSVS